MRGFFFLFACVLAVFYAFPFILVLINSVKDKRAVRNEPLSLPTEIRWENFVDAIKKMDYWQALGLLGSELRGVIKAGASGEPDRGPRRLGSPGWIQ